MEEVAVAVVARKLGLERRLELERRRGGLQLRVDVLVVVAGGHLAEVVAAAVLDLLAVVVGHGLLLDVGVVLRGAPGCVAHLRGSAGGRQCVGDVVVLARCARVFGIWACALCVPVIDKPGGGDGLPSPTTTRGLP